MKLHDGAFEVASAVGGGTTVTVSLPVKRAAAVVSPFARPDDEDGIARRADEGRKIA